jgi:hypothetical protein
MDFSNEMLMAFDALAEKHTREIFGNRRSLPADESAVAWDNDLTHEEKMEKLTTMRKAKAAKRAARKAARRPSPNPPRSFEERVTPIDSIRARGLRIRLD